MKIALCLAGILIPAYAAVSQAMDSIAPDQPASPRSASMCLISAVTPMKQVFREARTFQQPISRRYEMSAARGEFESMQVILLPMGKRLSDVSLVCSDLLNSSAARIDSSNITYNVVGYVPSSATYTTGPKVGWLWPDTLMPASPVAVDPGYLQPFWITIHVPANAKPGTYRGLITVQDSNGPLGEIMLSLRVFGFDLPKASFLKTAVSFDPFTWTMWHKSAQLEKLLTAEQRSRFNHCVYMNNDMLRLIPDEKWWLVYNMLLDHRISPSFIYPVMLGDETVLWPFPEHWQSLADKGMNTLCIANINIDWDKDAWWASPKHKALYKGDKQIYRQLLIRHLDKYYAMASKLKWDGLVYVYGFDESDIYARPGTAHNPAIQEFYSLIKERYPAMPRGSANPFNKIHFGLFDIWVPPTHYYDYNLASRRRALGEQIWPYICCGPGKPYSNTLLDYPAIDSRVLFWELRRSDCEGFLFYQVDYYCDQPNWNTSGPKWPQVPWNSEMFGCNGSGVFIYPGPDMTPLSSVRLENLRDGIDDYDYISLLRQMISKIGPRASALPQSLLARARAASLIPPAISASFAEHTYDPSLLEKQRLEIGSAIEQLQVYLEQETK